MLGRGLISEAPEAIPESPFPIDLPVKGGSTLDLGKRVTLNFIDTPGHSPDCLSAYFEKEEVLFSSDAAGFFIPPGDFYPNSWYSFEQSCQSFERLKEIDPRILCRGHYGAVEGRESVRRNLIEAHQSLMNFRGYIVEKIQAGASIEEIARQVTEQFSKGFLELFPFEDNYRLWRLLIRRTLEYLGIEIEEKG